MKKIIQSIKEFFRSTKNNKIGKAIFAILILILGIAINILLCLNLKMSNAKVLKNNHEEMQYSERVKRSTSNSNDLGFYIYFYLIFNSKEEWETFFYSLPIYNDYAEIEIDLNLNNKTETSPILDFKIDDIGDNFPQEIEFEAYLSQAYLNKGGENLIYLSFWNIDNKETMDNKEKLIYSYDLELYESDIAPITINSITKDTRLSSNSSSSVLYEINFDLRGDKWFTEEEVFFMNIKNFNYVNLPNYYTNKTFQLKNQLQFFKDFYIFNYRDISKSAINLSNKETSISTIPNLREKTIENVIFQSLFNAYYDWPNAPIWNFKKTLSLISYDNVQETTINNVFYIENLGYYSPFYIGAPTYFSFGSTFTNASIVIYDYSSFYSGDATPLYIKDIKNNTYWGQFMESMKNFNDFINVNATEVKADVKDAYASGYNQGYQDGKNEQAKVNFSLTELIKTAFNGIQEFLNFEILPYLKLGYLVLIPIVFKLLHFVFGWFR